MRQWFAQARDQTVIKFTLRSRYTYVAIKANGAWYTTAQSIGTLVPEITTGDDMARNLTKEQTTFEVAFTWLEAKP